MVLARAWRSSVTSRSWKVSSIRSTLPLAWGERANICWMPTSRVTLANWVVSKSAGTFPNGLTGLENLQQVRLGSYNILGGGNTAIGGCVPAPFSRKFSGPSSC